MFGTFINGLGIYVPEKILDNAYFEKIVNTSDEWIVSRTGIKRRHMAAEEEVTSDLALQATLAALQDAGRNVEEITHVIVATCNPDSLCPSTACVLINKLGIKNKKIMAIDVNAACSGFVNGLQLAQYIACSDPNALILVVSSEIMTSKCNWTDRSTCILFGDGAGAILISQQLPPNYHGFTAKIKDILINSDGSYSHLLTVKAGGTTLPYALGDTVGKEYFVLMEGREIFKHAVRDMTQICNDIMEKNNITIEDIDLVIPHQANQRIIEAVGQRLKASGEKLFSSVAEYGNTSSSTVPIALKCALQKGLIAGGKNVLITTFGGGFTWSAALFEIL